jgi:hypothetical protein
LRTHFATVEQTLILGFLRLEVEEKTLVLSVIEHHLPLLDARDIQVRPVIIRHVGEYILVVADDVHRQERHRVRARAGEIIDRAHNAFALALLPCGIAGFPILDVWLPVLY